MIKSIRLRWVGYIVRMEEGRRAFKILKYKPRGKRPLGRPRSTWEDNIWMDVKEIGINFEELGWFVSEWGLLDSSCECDIECPGSISHWVR